MFSKRRTYLDWAAAAPVSAAASRSYERAVRAYGNPSSPHTEGREAKAILEEARTDIARELMMKADDIVFTSGATEANNLAIQGVTIAGHSRGIGQPHVLYLSSMHASAVETLKSLTAWGIAIEPLSIVDGHIDIETLKSQLKPETVLVCVDFACGETGTLWNVREVRRALDEHRLSTKAIVYLHVDASQAPLTESLERTRLAGDLIVLDAQKVGGMRGTGVLAVPRTVLLNALMQGGGQERGIRPGTQDTAGASAFAAALMESGKERESFLARAVQARESLIKSVTAAIPDASVNEGARGIPQILNLSLPGRDTDYLVALLDEAGFAVSTKSACETDSIDGSRAVFALTGDVERSKATLRISWGPTTSDRDLARFSDALITAVQFLDSNPS